MRPILILALPGVPLLALAACHEPTGRVPHDNGPGIFTGATGPNVIRGTDGDDVLEGTPGHDRIDGGAGNDVICGGPCPDLPSHPKGEW